VLWVIKTVTVWLLAETLGAVDNNTVEPVPPPSRYVIKADELTIVLPYGTAPSFLVEPVAGGKRNPIGTLMSPGYKVIDPEPLNLSGIT